MLDVRLLLLVDVVVKRVPDVVLYLQLVAERVHEPLPVQAVQLDVLVVAPGLPGVEVGLVLPDHALVRVLLVHDLDLVLVNRALVDRRHHLDEYRQVHALHILIAVGIDLQSPLGPFALLYRRKQCALLQSLL